MSATRIEALRALGAVIAAAVPELAGKVKVGQAPSGVDQTYPTLTLIPPGPLKYEPAQALEHATIGEPSDGVVAFNVGTISGPLQLRLVATTIGERYALEEKVSRVFFAELLRPGVVVVPVTSMADELGEWIASFEYASDQWIDADAFDRKLESLVIVEAIIPVIVVRTGIYEIDEFVFGFTTDLETEFTADTMIPPGVETVRINQDGTISPYP